MEKRNNNSFRNSILVLVGFFIAPWFFYFPAWLTSMAIGDTLLEEWQTAAFLFDRLRNGIDPKWNPFLCSGFPICAYPNTGIYSVLNYFHLFLPHNIALTFIIMSIHCLSGVGFFLFLREWNVSHKGVFVGGLIFSFSGFFLGVPHFTYFMGGAPWLVFVLWALEKMRKSDNTRLLVFRIFVCAVLIAVQFCAGHPQLTIIAGAAYAVYAIYFAWREKNIKFFLAVMVSAFIAGALTVMVWLPAIELLPWSYREISPFQTFIALSVKPLEILEGIFLPSYINRPSFMFYVGAPAIYLAAFGLRSKKKSFVKYLTVCVAGSFLFGLGGYTPLFKLLYKIPLFNKLNAPARYGLVFCFSISALAALGYDEISRRGKPTNQKLLGRDWRCLCSNEGFTAFYRRLFWFLFFVSLAIFILGLRFTFRNLVGLSATLVGLSVVYAIWRNSAFPLLFLALCFLLPVTAWSVYGGLFFEGHNPEPKRAEHWETIENTMSAFPAMRVVDFVDLRTVSPERARTLPVHNIHIVNRWNYVVGYQPLALERYCRLLNMDTVGVIRNISKLLNISNRSLDILNASTLVIPAEFLKTSDNYFRFATEHRSFNGIDFSEPLHIRLKGSDKMIFNAPLFLGKVWGLAVISALDFSRDIEQGEEVAEIILWDANGENRRVKLRAGIETAEMIYPSYSPPTHIVDDIPFFNPVELAIWSGQEHTFHFYPREILDVAVESYLFNADKVKQGSIVGLAELTCSKRTFSFPLVAGRDTAHWMAGNSSFKVSHLPAKTAYKFTASGIEGRMFFSSLKIPSKSKCSSLTIKSFPGQENSGVFLGAITFRESSGAFSAVNSTGASHKKALALPDSNEDKGYKYFSKSDFDPIEPARIELHSLLQDRENSSLYLDAITFLRHEKNAPLHPVDLALGNADRFEVARVDDTAVVVKNKRVLPRAWFAKRCLVLPANDILRTLKEGHLANGESFDPRETVLMEDQSNSRHICASLFLEPPTENNDLIKFTAYEDSYLSLEVQTDSRKMLVLSEIFYPGWKCRVDGEITEILPVDYILRGVIIEPGKHQVEMTFFPRSLRKGRVISLVSFLFSLIMVIAFCRKGRPC